MKDKNIIIYFMTVIVIIIVYLVIYIFGVTIKKNIYAEVDEYQHNIPTQPVNNILSVNNNNNSSGENVVFSYETYDGNYIELYNQFPTADEVGMVFSGNKYTQDFKIKFNARALGATYSIILEKQPDSNMEDDWAKTYLTIDGTPVSNCFRSNGRVKTFDEYLNYQFNSTKKLLYQGVITYNDIKRGYKEFTLRMWVSEDVKVKNDVYFGKTFRTKVTVHAMG